MHTYRVTVELLTKDKSRHVKKIVETQADFDLESVLPILTSVEARRKWNGEKCSVTFSRNPDVDLPPF